MIKKNYSKYLIFFSVLALITLFSFFALASSITLSAIDQTRIVLFADLGLIDENNFDSEETLTEFEFNSWLAEILNYSESEDNLPLDGDETLIYSEAARYLINALDQKEFVLSYQDSFADEMKYWQAAQILALFEDIDHLINLNDPVNKIDGLTILTTAMQRAGKYHQYVIDLQNPAIYGKINLIMERLAASNIVDSAAHPLFRLGNKGLLKVTNGIFTGYTVKVLSEKPLFDFARTIRYGHSSVPHLLQLISLLRREGFNAQIGIESRNSSYIHLLKEWGEPPVYVKTTPLNDEKCIVHVNEYDLLLEFSSIADKKRFAGLIKKYAKKDNEGQKGLIKDSWFVPLFTSTTPLVGFEEVAEVRARSNGYAILSYALKDVAPSLKDQLQALNPDLDFEINRIWINKAFLAYLNSNVE